MEGRREAGGAETAGGIETPPASPRPVSRSRRVLASVGRILFLLFLAFFLAQGALALMISPALVASFLFFPSREDPGPAPTLAGVPGEDVLLTTPDGTRIHGWWHDAGPDAPAVIHLHGNAGTIAERAPIAAGFLRSGISIFMPDYRGYGRSEGKPVEEGVYEDARTALDWLQSRVGNGRVVLHGASLGGAVAARVAWERPEVAGVILESTFTSMEEMAAVAYPFLPSFVRGRLEGHFNTLSLMPDLQMPVLVIHGHADTLIPVAMGRSLYQAAGDGATWYEVQGAGHNDVFVAGGDPYFQRMADFVRRVTAPPQPAP